MNTYTAESYLIADGYDSESMKFNQLQKIYEGESVANQIKRQIHQTIDMIDNNTCMYPHMLAY